MTCLIKKAKTARLLYKDGLITDVELMNTIVDLIYKSKNFKQFTKILKAAAGREK